MHSLIHDAAFQVAQDIIGIFAGLLREEEMPDAFAEVYEAVKRRLAEYETKAARRLTRLNPSGN